MNLQIKIGFGFGVLVLTCLGLTLGTWYGTNILESRQVELHGTDQPGYSYQEISKKLTELQGMLDRREGQVEVRSVVEDLQFGVRQRAEAVNAGQEEILHLQEWIKKIAVFLSIFGTLAGIGIAWFLSQMITRPINLTIEKVKQIATGDLSIEIPVLTKDEVGSLGIAMNSMTRQLNDMFTRMKKSSVELSEAAHGLSGLAGAMSTCSEQAAQDSLAMADMALELSRNMGEVTLASGESSENVNAVDSAIQDMAASAEEIARDSETAREITESAVRDAQVAAQSVNNFGVAAQEITKVTEAITEIADQTNLLALNATIEAARAGEAGKGFAVVANEIKGLASQTAIATGQIKSRIDGLQGSSAQVVEGMESIITTISRVNEIVVSITNSVAEQAVASKEISDNIAGASAGIASVSSLAVEVSGLNETMVSDLNRVSREITQLREQCLGVTRAAEDQTKIAHSLDAYSSKFTLA